MKPFDKINADYIYCLLNEKRMTLSELLSLSHLDKLSLSRALTCLRQENELSEYAEDGTDYIELRYGYAI